MTLADTGLWVALLAMIGREPLSVTSHLDIDFLRKPAPADVIAHTMLHKVGKRLAVGDVLMYSAGEDVPCARASVTYAIPSVRPIRPRTAGRGVTATTSSPTDRARVDLDVVHRFISEESYWAQGAHARRTSSARTTRRRASRSCTSRPTRRSGSPRVLSDDVRSAGSPTSSCSRRTAATASACSSCSASSRRTNISAAGARYPRRARRVRQSRLSAAGPGRAVDGALVRRAQSLIGW